MNERPETLPPDETDESVESGPVKHGGEGDPLGGGVDPEENPNVTDDDGAQSDVGAPRPPA